MEKKNLSSKHETTWSSIVMTQSTNCCDVVRSHFLCVVFALFVTICVEVCLKFCSLLLLTATVTHGSCNFLF